MGFAQPSHAQLPERAAGLRYDGNDPEGFMSMPEVIDFIATYAGVIDAPVQESTAVTRVGESDDGYLVETSKGDWRCRSLVLANGACNVANVPGVSDGVPDDILQVTPMEYKSPADLPEGGVLVVGASATGVQLAEEIHLSGRPVTLAVGEHVRMPRRYRGRDILHWMSQSGILDEGWTRSTTSYARAAFLRRSLLGPPSASTWTSMSSRASVSRSWASLSESGTARLSSRARSKTTARWPISNAIGS